MRWSATRRRCANTSRRREGIVSSDDAWRRVSPFKGVDAPVIRYLSEEQIRRLVNACSVDFRDLVRGALLTGCRYGELIALRAADYNDDAGTVTVRESKAGKVRHAVLTDEGRALFKGLTAGRKSDDRVFVRGDGKPWGASHQQRPLADACVRARISPPVSFHILPSFARVNACYARRSNGSYRSATRTCRHADDGKALRTPRAVLCRRYDPCKFPEAQNYD